jgi:hypothetical protein
VWDAHVAQRAGQQFNRISRLQLIEVGLTDAAISRWVSAGRLITVEEGVFAVAPLREDDEWGRWMGATLTAPQSALSHSSAANAWGVLSLDEAVTTITRPGSGGPRRFGGVLAFRSLTLDGDVMSVQGIPITSISRTLLDLARTVSQKALARAVREAIRLEHTTLAQLGDRLGDYRGRRGSRRLAHVIARYAGLPLERARSGAEIMALEVLRTAGRPLPRLNARIAGEEADLSWPDARLIVEVDGGPFHLDRGEDARKQRRWEGAGWIVRRISSNDVYERPHLLLALAPNVPEYPSQRKLTDVRRRALR